MVRLGAVVEPACRWPGTGACGEALAQVVRDGRRWALLLWSVLVALPLGLHRAADIARGEQPGLSAVPQDKKHCLLQLERGKAGAATRGRQQPGFFRPWGRALRTPRKSAQVLLSLPSCHISSNILSDMHLHAMAALVPP